MAYIKAYVEAFHRSGYTYYIIYYIYYNTYIGLHPSGEWQGEDFKFQCTSYYRGAKCNFNTPLHHVSCIFIFRHILPQILTHLHVLPLPTLHMSNHNAPLCFIFNLERPDEIRSEINDLENPSMFCRECDLILPKPIE